MLSIMPPPKFKAFDSNGKPLAGGKVYTYIPGTSTPKTTYADPDGTSANPNPVILDSNGEAVIWLQGVYKIVLTDSNNVQQWSVDQVSSSPSVATPNAEWLSVNASFTFISSTQFSVTGDMTGTYQPGRRVQLSVSAGTVYGTVTSSVYSGGVTAVTVACDSGSLDSGLSAANVGLLSAANPSVPMSANSAASALPWADARAYASLSAAISAIGAARRTIVISTALSVTGNLTVPSNVALEFMQGGSLNISTGVTVTINGNIEAGLFQIFTLNGSGNAVFGPFVKEVYPEWFGAVGDGVTDDTTAIQAASNAAFTQYSATQMNFYTEQNQIPLYFSKKIFLISNTLDWSFRNDIKAVFSGAKLKWAGSQDGAMIELKCSSRVKLVDLKLDGNNLAGTFIHHSGNGTSEASAVHDALTGKGNVSYNDYWNIYCENQYTGSSKAVIDTIPYPADSAYPYYYSMDDSHWYSLKVRTGGTNGFGAATASFIAMYSPEFVCPNGILLPSVGGGDLELHNPIFTLQANTYGAIYAQNNVNIDNIDIFGGYLEGTAKPLFSFDPAATTGSIKKLGIYGGDYSQNSGATAFISVPGAILGSIYIDGARNSSSTAGLTLKVDAALCYVSLNSGSIDELQGTTSYADRGFAVTNALFTDLDNFHSERESGQAGYGAPTIAALAAVDMARTDIIIPPYRKLYLTKASFQIAATDSSGDFRLKVNCSNSGLTWTSPSYYTTAIPNFLLYDNSASSAPITVNVVTQIYNSNGTTAHTPQNYAGWSLQLDNR